MNLLLKEFEPLFILTLTYFSTGYTYGYILI